MTDETTPTFTDISAYEARAIRHNYFQRVICELDILGNVLTGGNLGETISARSSRWARKQHAFFLWHAIAHFMIWWLDLIQKNHGVRAEAGDLIRAVRVVETERADLGLSPIDLLKE